MTSLQCPLPTRLFVRRRLNTCGNDLEDAACKMFLFLWNLFCCQSLHAKNLACTRPHGTGIGGKTKLTAQMVLSRPGLVATVSPHNASKRSGHLLRAISCSPRVRSCEFRNSLLDSTITHL
jgi:hypothetical protein